MLSVQKGIIAILLLTGICGTAFADEVCFTNHSPQVVFVKFVPSQLVTIVRAEQRRCDIMNSKPVSKLSIMMASSMHRGERFVPSMEVNIPKGKCIVATLNANHTFMVSEC